MSSGNTRKWFRMPLGVVSGVGLGMGVLDFGGDRRRGRGSFASMQSNGQSRADHGNDRRSTRV